MMYRDVFQQKERWINQRKDNLWTRAASNAAVTKSLLFSQLNSEHFASWTLDLTQCDNCYIEQALHRLVS